MYHISYFFILNLLIILFYSLIIEFINLIYLFIYVSPPEAMWRLHEHQLFYRSHTIERLPVHLPEEQMVYFQAGYESNVDLDKNSKLMAFFKLCNENITARNYFCHEIPEHFVWSKGQWNIRKKKQVFWSNLHCQSSRYRKILPTNTTIINHYIYYVKEPQSLDDIRTVGGILCNSFQHAAEKLHLTINDSEWKECLQEAVNTVCPLPCILKGYLQMVAGE